VGGDIPPMPGPVDSCHKHLLGVFCPLASLTCRDGVREKFSLHDVSLPLRCGLNFVLVLGGNRTELPDNDSTYTLSMRNWELAKFSNFLPQARLPSTGDPDAGDTVHLPTNENWHTGKVLTWFHAAAAGFPEAEYMYKVDSDVKICDSARLRDYLDDAAESRADYIGWPHSHASCGGHAYCPDGSWTYMSGGFYGVTMQVARRLARSSWVAQHRTGTEDLLAGRWVYRVLRAPRLYNLTCLYETTVVKSRFGLDQAISPGRAALPGCPLSHSTSEKRDVRGLQPCRYAPPHHVRHTTSPGEQIVAANETGAYKPTSPTHESTLVHVTHTHSDTLDVWSLAFDTLGRYSYSIGNVTHFLCLNRQDARIQTRWPWLKQVMYSGSTFSQKSVACLDGVSSLMGRQPDYVFHTMEDMILIGHVRWDLIWVAVEILRQASEVNHFRFFKVPPSCDAVKPRRGWQRAECGTKWADVTISKALVICPLVASFGELRRLHMIGEQEGTGSDFEISYNRRPSLRLKHPLVFLQGFVDLKDYQPNSVCLASRSGECATRRYAYPAIHTAIATSAWRTDWFAPVLCPYLNEKQLTLRPRACSCCGTASECAKPHLRPVSACGNGSRTGAKGSLAQETLVDPRFLEVEAACIVRPPAVSAGMLYPKGCATWREKGSPPIPPVVQGLSANTVLLGD